MWKKRAGISILFVCLVLSELGCSTAYVQMVDRVTHYSVGPCEVDVYQTKAKALEAGNITEMCIVSGSSAFSFDHSIEGAIKNNIKKVCDCGVTNAYIESRHTQSEMGIKGVSHVTLVGFRYQQ
ncbi:MAG: hypothetical protein HYS23_04385 [Geobacter sp.]|nr:hypothetical protein [Geobacter sp.]